MPSIVYLLMTIAIASVLNISIVYKANAQLSSCGTDSECQLRNALILGQVTTINQLLDTRAANGIDLNEMHNYYNRTWLQWTGEQMFRYPTEIPGLSRGVEALLDSDADPNRALWNGSTGWTSRTTAIGWIFRSKANAPIINHLLEAVLAHGQKIDGFVDEQKRGFSILQLSLLGAAFLTCDGLSADESANIVKRVLEKGADPNGKDNVGHTLLMRMVFLPMYTHAPGNPINEGCFKNTKDLLINSGVTKLNVADSEGYLAIDWSRIYPDQSSINTQENPIECTTDATMGWGTPSMRSAKRELAERLIAKGSETGKLSGGASEFNCNGRFGVFK